MRALTPILAPDGAKTGKLYCTGQATPAIETVYPTSKSGISSTHVVPPAGSIITSNKVDPLFPGIKNPPALISNKNTSWVSTKRDVVVPSALLMPGVIPVPGVVLFGVPVIFVVQCVHDGPRGIIRLIQ